ncbi:hypothetical protein AX15_002277 [Amanita polypyramis BW_CC]|nr:hypothetical protein AX15_002277 [Amanita polypyramis BW_CC]
MGLLIYISYVAVVAAFAFVTISLASGLLYISELIEEHSRLAKIVGQRGLYVVVLLHVLLYFSDSLPLGQTAFSILCHIVYLQNFSGSWPLISLASPSFIASCVLVLADHFTWFFHFARITHEARHLRTYRNPPPNTPGFTEIASFFAVCVWLVPLFLFLSLSANDNTLPMSAADPGTPTTSGLNQATQTRVSLIRSIFSLFSFDIFPRVRHRSHRKDTSEGLIAPRSPKDPQTPTHIPSTPILGSSPRFPTSHSMATSHLNPKSPPPPRSPGPLTPRGQEFAASLSTNSSFKLGVPPSKRPGALARRQTSDTIGIGIRHVM